jgi:hypothetical protein
MIEWHIGQGNGYGSVFADSGRMYLGPGGTTLVPVATVHDFEGDRDRNLALIAAAPKMLKALERLTNAAFSRDVTMGDVCSLLAAKVELAAAVQEGRAAIAKAKETP